MDGHTPERLLYSFDQAAELLGGSSVWTLRKHRALGNIQVVKIGCRVFLSHSELQRIAAEGLPPLQSPDKARA